jgi:hypothetical protein
MCSMPQWNTQTVRVIGTSKNDPTRVVTTVIRCSGVEQRCPRHYSGAEQPTIKATFHVYGISGDSLAGVLSPMELCFADPGGMHYSFKVASSYVVDQDTAIFTWLTA